VFVRRGIFGSAILAVSDIAKASPLLIVVMLQGSLFLILTFLTWNIASRMDHPNAYWLLVLSPAFFMIFWATDPQGSMRKELIIYVSFFVFLQALISSRYPNFLFNLSGIIFLIGIVAHEANLLFVPVFVFCGYMAFRAGLLSKKFAGIWLFVLTLGSIFVVVFSLLFSRIETVESVCSPLLARGLSPEICGGAIKWLTYEIQYALNETSDIFSSRTKFTFPVLYILASVSPLYFATLTENPARVRLIFGLSAIPFGPLYFFAVDWGRWMNFHISSFVFVMFCLALTGNLRASKEPQGRVLAGLVFVSLIVSPPHTF